jgi:hypothetical protein
MDENARPEIHRRQHVYGTSRQMRQTRWVRHAAQPDVHLRRIRPREQRRARSLDGVLGRMAQQPAKRARYRSEVPRRRNPIHGVRG